MKRPPQIALRVAAVLTVLSLPACNKPVAENESEPIVESTPPPATPVATPAIVAATPEPNYFAPPGIHFLVSAASVETTDSVVGLKPGTRLKQIGPGKYTDGTHQLELRDSQVTNDLRIAQRVIGADQAAQAAWRQAMQAADAAQADHAAVATPAATPNTVAATGRPARPASSRSAGIGASGSFGNTRSKDGWIGSSTPAAGGSPSAPTNSRCYSGWCSRGSMSRRGVRGCYSHGASQRRGYTISQTG